MRLSWLPAAAAASAVYSTGRLRCASTLSHSVVRPVNETASECTAALPRARPAGTPSTDASPADPATPSNTASLARPACSSTGCTAQRSIPHRLAGSHGAHGGGPCGSFSAAGSTASRPAPPTVATSPQPAVYAARWARSVDGVIAATPSSRLVETVARRERNTAGTTYVTGPCCAKHHGGGTLRFPAPPAKLYRRFPTPEAA